MQHQTIKKISKRHARGVGSCGSRNEEYKMRFKLIKYGYFKILLKFVSKKIMKLSTGGRLKDFKTV